MIDRAIGLVGIALAVLFGLAPFTDFKLPIWATYAGIGLGIWLFGVAVGLFAGAQRKPGKGPQIIETNLFLQFSDSHSVPVEKNPRNIQSWYALYTESIYVGAKDVGGRMVGGFSVPPRWTIFIIFEKPPIFRQIVADCRGPNNPKCDVQTSNLTYAIITINGDVTNATLDVSLVR